MSKYGNLRGRNTAGSRNKKEIAKETRVGRAIIRAQIRDMKMSQKYKKPEKK